MYLVLLAYVYEECRDYVMATFMGEAFHWLFGNEVYEYRFCRIEICLYFGENIDPFT